MAKPFENKQFLARVARLVRKPAPPTLAEVPKQSDKTAFLLD
jgi:hypothetical protein